MSGNRKGRNRQPKGIYVSHIQSPKAGRRARALRAARRYRLLQRRLARALQPVVAARSESAES